MTLASSSQPLTDSPFHCILSCKHHGIRQYPCYTENLLPAPRRYPYFCWQQNQNFPDASSKKGRKGQSTNNMTYIVLLVMKRGWLRREGGHIPNTTPCNSNSWQTPDDASHNFAFNSILLTHKMCVYVCMYGMLAPSISWDGLAPVPSV